MSNKKPLIVLNKIMNVIGTVAVAIVLLIAIGLIGLRVAELKMFTVVSGSMAPTYEVGDMIFVKDTDYLTLKEGDVITFMADETTVATQRIIEVVPDEKNPEVIRFMTQGDVNKSKEGIYIHYKNVIGQPVFKIPFLGYAADLVKNPPGKYYVIAFGVVLLIYCLLPESLFKEKEEKAEE